MILTKKILKNKRPPFSRDPRVRVLMMGMHVQSFFRMLLFCHSQLLLVDCSETRAQGAIECEHMRNDITHNIVWSHVLCNQNSVKYLRYESAELRPR